MAAVDDSSDVDDKEELVGCFGEEDNEDFWFMDGKSSSPLSPTSTFDFIDSSDLFDNSGDLSDGYDLKPDLEDITDSSDNEEDDVPSLKLFLESSEDEDNLYGDYQVPEMSGESANIEEGYDSMPNLIPDYDNWKDDDSEDGNFSREFLDGEGDRLVEDLGDDAFMRTFTCTMLANTERVETKLYDSGASHHMTTYCDQLENFVSIMTKSIAATDKCHFQATGKGNLHIKIPNRKMMSSILLTYILYCPKMGLTLILISKLVDAGFHSHFRSHSKIFDGREKVIEDILQRNGLY